MENNVIEKLKKISEIAAKNTSKALSKMVGREVVITKFDVKIEQLEKINNIIDLGAIVESVYLFAKGNVKGDILFLMPKETALILCDLLLKIEPGAIRKLTKLDESALEEVGNILTGSYFTVLSNTLQIEIIAQPPSFSFDIFGVRAVIDRIINKMDPKTKEVLIMGTEFFIKPFTLNTYLILFFADEAIKVISNALERNGA